MNNKEDLMTLKKKTYSNNFEYVIYKNLDAILTDLKDNQFNKNDSCFIYDEVKEHFKDYCINLNKNLYLYNVKDYRFYHIVKDEIKKLYPDYNKYEETIKIKYKIIIKKEIIYKIISFFIMFQKLYFFQ